MHQLSHHIFRGTLWNLAGISLSRGASILFTLFLANFLAPEAFGLIAMVMIVFDLAGVFVQSGLGQALIQTKTIDSKDINTVFITNICFSLIAYAALYATAPIVASFYSQDELTSLIRAMGIVVFINAAKTVHIAMLSREMNFKHQMKANTIGVLVSGIAAVIAAYLHAGVWSLVLQIILSSLVSTSVLWFSTKWKPSNEFSYTSFSRLFRFGANLMAEGIITVLYQNSYILVVGRFFGVDVTGLYFFAKKLSNFASQQLTVAVQQAAFPALSSLQDNDEFLRHKYRQIIQLTMFAIAPVMLILAGLARHFFELLLDEKWLDAIPYFQLLCLVGMLFPLHAMSLNIMSVKGRSDLVLTTGIIKKSINIVLLISAIPFGVIGIVTSQVIGSFIALIPNTYYSTKLINYDIKTQVYDASKPILSAVISAISVWAIAHNYSESTLLLLVVMILVAIIIYLLMCFLFKVEGFNLLATQIMKKFHLTMKNTGGNP
ncbi:MAG: lipopolysaccharide biosynthesis protein [Candidatus Thiodiazotropha sp.]